MKKKNKKMVKMVRGVTCDICKKEMFYVGDKRHEPEVYICVTSNGMDRTEHLVWQPKYVHLNCWNLLSYHQQSIEQLQRQLLAANRAFGIMLRISEKAGLVRSKTIKVKNENKKR